MNVRKEKVKHNYGKKIEIDIENYLKWGMGFDIELI